VNAQTPIHTHRIPDDMAMIRAAAELTRDLNTPSPRIYWCDLIASATLGYGAMAAAMMTATPWKMVVAVVVSILALYRAGSFIHELTHISKNSLPGFRLFWNAIMGVPLMLPSFMYEGLHNLHHARTRYGTVEDPEYLPLALMKPWTIPLFVVAAAFGPLALLLRYGVLAPLSLLVPPLRRLLVERYSGLVINPAFRRRPPEGTFRTQWLVSETAVSLWAMALIALIAMGAFPTRNLLIYLGIVSGSVVLNQFRTLVAHLWQNDGEVMSTTAQYLDSVNVPPPALLPAIWAPVGLRYHAIHHLLPGLPYHALGEAHRRMIAALPTDSTYHQGNYDGLPGLVARLVGKTFMPRPKPLNAASPSAEDGNS
jgi:fatty acid desaturase